MGIKIVLPEGDGPKVGNGVHVFTDKGEEITGIRSIDISMRPDSIVVATLELIVHELKNAEHLGVELGPETMKEIKQIMKDGEG